MSTLKGTLKGTLRLVEGYPRIEQNGLQILLNILGSSYGLAPPAQRDDGNAVRDTVPDPIFVAVDFENTHQFRGALTPDLNFQVGLAILDTRDLHQARRQSIPTNEFVKTFNFVCGSSEYFSRAYRRFQFGLSIKIQQADMLDYINSAIAQSHDQEQRAIVLVGHGLASDCRVLSQLGFDFQRVVACVDSLQVCGQVLPYFALRLYELLDEIQCPYGMLHNGGNDAMFALRALLLLTAKHLRSKKDDHYQGEEIDMADYLETIGRLPLPDQPPGRAALTSGH